MSVSTEFIQNAINNPAQFYRSPIEVSMDRRLNHQEKNKVLDSWELDMKSLLTSEDENMGPNGTMAPIQSTMRDILTAREKIEEHPG